MFKIVLFLIAVFVLLWLLRGARGAGPQRAGQAREAATPRAIVACAQCGVHLPSDEALPGRGGVFCSEAHRTAFESKAARPDA